MIRKRIDLLHPTYVSKRGNFGIKHFHYVKIVYNSFIIIEAYSLIQLVTVENISL